jgi:radical SAM superfamily enzyme YgiQ (UPF0313 family)
MRYVGTVYRPPSEAGSLVIQAEVGCPHNRCAFCGMYRDRRFRARPLAEVEEDLDRALEAFGPDVRTVFLADGNCAALSTDRLVALGEAVGERFPHLQRITVYGSAKFLVKKTRQEWQRVRAAGICRVHTGLESGDPVTLERLHKGVTPDQAATAFGHLMAAGLQLSVYIMVGVAGAERWQEHAEGSAEVLNRASPDFVRLRTFVPIPGTPWHDRWARGELTLLSAHEALRETRRLLELLSGPTTVASDHVSNFLDVGGRLPDDREAMLAMIDEALEWPLSRFRPPTERLVGMVSL